MRIRLVKKSGNVVAWGNEVGPVHIDNISWPGLTRIELGPEGRGGLVTTKNITSIEITEE